MKRERSELAEIKAKLLKLTEEIGGKGKDSLEEDIHKGLLPLFTEAERVAFYAHEFAQDKAVEYVARYTNRAADLQMLVGSHRRLRMDEARAAIGRVNESASSLVLWVVLCVITACILIGPIGLTTMHSVLARLRGVTLAMANLARNDTTTLVPSRHDPDEVGDMARAVEVFKDNAIQLIAREVELKQLNRRVDIALNNMTHGLCMFDAEQKLIVCNKSYVEMYELTPELARPGTVIHSIETHRATVGNNALEILSKSLLPPPRTPHFRPLHSRRS